MSLPTLIARGAKLSDDRVYRYSLMRRWGPEPSNVLRWIMLNPSRADDLVEDATVRRCISLSHAAGYDALLIHNLFALRATDPARLVGHPDPVGPENDAVISGWTMDTLCAWGANGSVTDARVREVFALMRPTVRRVLCLGVTKHGHPKHPVRLSAKVRPVEFPAYQRWLGPATSGKDA